jgi:hypothetical protein
LKEDFAAQDEEDDFGVWDIFQYILNYLLGSWQSIATWRPWHLFDVGQVSCWKCGIHTISFQTMEEPKDVDAFQTGNRNRRCLCYRSSRCGFDCCGRSTEYRYGGFDIKSASTLLPTLPPLPLHQNGCGWRLSSTTEFILSPSRIQMYLCRFLFGDIAIVVSGTTMSGGENLTLAMQQLPLRYHN